MMKTTKLCPITQRPMEPCFRARVMGKHDVQYYYSPDSGLIQTEHPYWLDEATRSAISDSDVGLVERNLQNRDRLLPVLYVLGGLDTRILDVAGGYGLFARLLRDRGFDCYTTDPFCENLFCRNFEPEEGFKAGIILALEVMEHLANPLEFLRRSIRQYESQYIILSTVTFRKNRIPESDWWYYAFETGQHITFYQDRSLQLCANALHYEYLPLGKELHLFARSQPPKALSRLRKNPWTRRRVFRKMKGDLKGRSLLPSDYEKVRNISTKCTRNI